jgi:hypothetical protein
VKLSAKPILAAATMVLVLVTPGCTTQEIDQSPPPYASISDEGRDPPPTPPQQQDDNSRGFWGSALHFILVGMGFHVD